MKSMTKTMKKFNKSSLLALGLVGIAAQPAYSADSTPLVLLKSQEIPAAEAARVIVAPPSGFDEGTETKLSTDQVNEILPWANNSKIALSDLLESTKELSATQARDVMVRGIQDVVLASAPRRTETLMRYVLNRALKVNHEIQSEADTSQPGVIDQQLRLLRQSIRFALRYYQSDVAFLNGVVQKKVDAVVLPFAQFGVEYAKFLMSLDQSIFDASAQYNVAVMALQLLQWDLYRDQNHLAYAPVIARIDLALKTLPLKSAPRDSDTVALLRQVKKTYLAAVSLLQKLGMKVAPVSVPPVSYESRHGGDCIGQVCVGDVVYPDTYTKGYADVVAVNQGTRVITVKGNLSASYDKFDVESLAISSGCIEGICVGDTVIPETYDRGYAEVIAVNSFTGKITVKGNLSADYHWFLPEQLSKIGRKD